MVALAIQEKFIVNRTHNGDIQQGSKMHSGYEFTLGADYSVCSSFRLVLHLYSGNCGVVCTSPGPGPYRALSRGQSAILHLQLCVYKYIENYKFYQKYFSLYRTSRYANFSKPGNNYVSLACSAPPDKSKHLSLTNVLYENDRIVAGKLWVPTINQ